MYVPTEMLRRHPSFAEALQKNQERLVSFFDLHETLKHLLTFPKYSTDCYGFCPDMNTPGGTVNTSISLFHTVPADRSCADAGIPEEHCACGDGHKILPFSGKNKKVLHLMDNMLAWVNEKVTSVENTTCSTLSEPKLEQPVLFLPSTHEYQVRFRVREGVDGGAVFQIVARNKPTDSVSSWQILDRVQKSRYAKYDSCSDHRVGRQWCVCQPDT